MAEVIVRQATTEAEMAALQALRLAVFVQEQGVPEALEIDGLDALAYHAIACVEDAIIGTGRLLVLPGGDALIGRMAVQIDLRRIGIGGHLLKYLEGAAQKLGAAKTIVHAQSYVSEFYQRNGYKQEGKPFDEAGIQHILMRKSLK
jgi:predicted GNAT family N-acyltransferase